MWVVDTNGTAGNTNAALNPNVEAFFKQRSIAKKDDTVAQGDIKSNVDNLNGMNIHMSPTTTTSSSVH
jgi:hypothetical protein